MPRVLQYGRIDGARWRRLATIIAAVLALLGAALLTYNSLVTVRDRRALRRSQINHCRENLSVIASAISAYSASHAGAIPRFEDLVLCGSINDPRVFVCPAGGDDPASGSPVEQAAQLTQEGYCSYRRFDIGHSIFDGQPILVAEPLGLHETGAHVILRDGSIRFISPADFKHLFPPVKFSER
ncbi:MAG TPA: hypothetical protein VF669_04225 [Tepidisphaeraceae bacterium]|jgi:hypothetical protein